MSPGRDGDRPRRDGHSVEQQRSEYDTPVVSRPSDWGGNTLLLDMNDHESDLWHRAYFTGLLHGELRGYDRAHAEMDVRHATIARRVMRINSQPMQSELHACRGYSERAARARENERRVQFGE